MANDTFPPVQNGHDTGAAAVQSQPRLAAHIHKERQMKVICIGAGASGLLFAYKLQRSFEQFELTIYEKNDKVSGTWYENRYPGCACDTPAHNYTWSFEPKADWSSVYASGNEIFDYFNTFATKYDLRKYCKAGHKVTGAIWNESKGGWDVDVTDLSSGATFHDHCHFLINASGILNAWRWPDIPGLKDYNGTLLHTANWDTAVDLTDKHVGLIGNGSSGIQVLPAIHPKVRKITTFIRGPTWVSPTQGLEQHVYSEEERREFATKPDVHLAHRKATEEMLNGLFPMFISGSDEQHAIRSTIHAQMREKLHNDYLEEKLIPTWAFGCRRLTPGVGYLETLGADNVDIVHGNIERITERGCLSADGNEYPVDVLICATGFNVSFKPRFTLIGLEGKSLADEWADEPKSYLSMAAHGFPNYFVVLGPNSPVGNGPLLCVIEAQIDYMLKMMDRWQTEKIHSMSPKMAAVEDFNAYKDQFMENTVWREGCHSWYKNNSTAGKVTALWPGSVLHFLETIADVHYDDWDVTYSGNRFAFLGNGFSQTELDRTADWTYYIRDRDDGPYLSRKKQIKVINKSGSVKRPENARVGMP